MLLLLAEEQIDPINQKACPALQYFQICLSEKLREHHGKAHERGGAGRGVYNCVLTDLIII